MANPYLVAHLKEHIEGARDTSDVFFYLDRKKVRIRQVAKTGRKVEFYLEEVPGE